MNAWIGAPLTLKKPPSQPHWKIATTTPSAAPIESRFMIAACNGITSERKTTSSSSAESSTTMPMNSGSLLESTLREVDRERVRAADEQRSRPCWPPAAAARVPRRWRTSSVVASACGAERG